MGLFSEFAKPGSDEWKSSIERSLKGKSLESLEFKIGDLTFRPYYQESDNADQKTGKAIQNVHQKSDNQDVRIIPWLYVSNSFTASHLDDLHKDLNAKGISEIGLEIGSVAPKLFAQVLDSVEALGFDRLHFYFSSTDLKQSRAFLDCIEEKGLKANQVGTISPDIVSLMLGHCPTEEVLSWLEKVQICFPEAKTFLVDSNGLINRGFLVYEELAMLLEILCSSVEEFFPGADISELIDKHFRFRISPGIDMMVGVSKLQCWKAMSAGVLSELGGREALSLDLEMISSKFYHSPFDKENNILRQGSQLLSGMFAGADIIHVSAFDEIRSSDPYLGSWISSNLVFLFKEESRVMRVKNPLNGSYYLRELNGKISARAWDIFRKMRSEGGMKKSESFRSLLDSAGERSSRGASAVDDGSLKVIGLNLFPDGKEELSQEEVVRTKEFVEDQKILGQDVVEQRLGMQGSLKCNIIMLGTDPSRFSEANSVSNKVGVLGIPSRTLESTELEQQNFGPGDLVVFVGDLEHPDTAKISTLEDGATGLVAVLDKQGADSLPIEHRFNPEAPFSELFSSLRNE